MWKGFFPDSTLRPDIHYVDVGFLHTGRNGRKSDNVYYNYAFDGCIFENDYRKYATNFRSGE